MNNALVNNTLFTNALSTSANTNANANANANANLYQMKKIIDINYIDLNKYYVHNSILFFEYSNYHDIKTHHSKIINSPNNIIYYYKPTIENNIKYNKNYIYDFLLIMHSSRLDIPIITSEDKYFKPFQYSICDITLYKYQYPFKIVEELFIEKHSLHFLVDNTSKNIIRV
jgi:hypothetical protein